MLKNEKKRVFLCSASLLLLAWVYGEFGYAAYPEYLQDAKNVVSSKMSSSFGLSECKASQPEGREWMLSCTPIKGEKPELEFTVLPSSKAPYEVPTSFYLIATNEAARQNASEGLLGYLMINTELRTPGQRGG